MRRRVRLGCDQSVRGAAHDGRGGGEARGGRGVARRGERPARTACVHACAHTWRAPSSRLAPPIPPAAPLPWPTHEHGRPRHVSRTSTAAGARGRPARGWVVGSGGWELESGGVGCVGWGQRRRANGRPVPCSLQAPQVGTPYLPLVRIRWRAAGRGQPRPELPRQAGVMDGSISVDLQWVRGCFLSAMLLRRRC